MALSPVRVPSGPGPRSFGAPAAGISRREVLDASLRVGSNATEPRVRDILEIEGKHDKRILFSDMALEEAAALPDLRSEFSRRPWVRGVTLTIDDYSSQDLDDGLSFYREADGTIVIGLSVADVSAWIRPGSVLDFVARHRVKSHYRSNPKITVPMLPLPLSDDLFSLRHGRPRLSKTVEMRFSNAGSFLGHRIFRSVFRSQHRLDAKDARAGRDGQGPGATDAALREALDVMTSVAAKLKRDAHSPEVDTSDDGSATRLNVQRMLEILIVHSSALVGESLHQAGLHTSYRNQDASNTRALYGKLPTGHADVRVPVYARWTSPIRRYGDLDVHRAMDRLIDGKRPTGRLRELDDRMRDMQHDRANGDLDRRRDFIGLLRRVIQKKHVA